MSRLGKCRMPGLAKPSFVHCGAASDPARFHVCCVSVSRCASAHGTMEANTTPENLAIDVRKDRKVE